MANMIRQAFSDPYYLRYEFKPDCALHERYHRTQRPGHKLLAGKSTGVSPENSGLGTSGDGRVVGIGGDGGGGIPVKTSAYEGEDYELVQQSGVLDGALMSSSGQSVVACQSRTVIVLTLLSAGYLILRYSALSVQSFSCISCAESLL